MLLWEGSGFSIDAKEEKTSLKMLRKVGLFLHIYIKALPKASKNGFGEGSHTLKVFAETGSPKRARRRFWQRFSYSLIAKQ